jgi:hypothetical protein
MENQFMIISIIVVHDEILENKFEMIYIDITYLIRGIDDTLDIMTVNG